jgi:hypothetical protein
VIDKNRNAAIRGDFTPQGVIANKAYGSTTIERAAAEGFEVTSGGSWSGGAAIEDCFAAAEVAGSQRGYCAGLVGEAGAATIVRRCFASGAIDLQYEGAGLVGISTAATNKPVFDALIAMNPSVGKAGYSSTYYQRYSAIYAAVVESGKPLSSWAAATSIYACSAMTIDGAAGPWIMTANGPSLRNMPQGGGSYGTPAIDG